MGLFTKHKHTAPAGYGNDAPYGTPQWFATDGMGTQHFHVLVKCATCGKEYAVANFHIAKDRMIP